MGDSQGEKEDGKRNDVCRDYERGVCHRGNKCKFFHPPDIPPPDKNKLPVCRDFQNGICDRKNCKYMHITSQEERTYMKTGELPSNVRRPGEGGPGGRSKGSDNHDPVCKDFLNNLCDRGARCKFRHVTEEDWEYEKRYGVPPPPAGRKRKRDSFSNLDTQFLEDENDMLRRKIADLQRQVANLRAMNDTLYDQNIRYRAELRSGASAPPPPPRERAPVSYPGYSRDEPVRYPDEYRSPSYPPPSRDVGNPPPSSGYPPSGYSKDPYAPSSYGNNSYDGYTKFD